MSDQEHPGRFDEVISADGDQGFMGVDMRTPPQNLPPGMVSFAENCRFRFGSVEPRRGTQALTWTSLLGIEFPITFPINWNTPISTGAPVGVGLWADPNGDEWQLIAAVSTAFTLDDGGGRVLVWAIKPGNNIRAVPVLADISSTEGEVWFESCFNVVTLHRGPGADPLVMTNIDEGFKPITLSEGGSGTVPIPRSRNATFFQNRLLVPHRPENTVKADNVAVSDVLDYTRYLEQINDFRINQGDSDEIVRVVPFNEQSVVVFKDSSIYAVSGLVGDYTTNARLDLVTDEFGLVGQRSVATVGPDLVFLSTRGVTTLRQTELNKTQGVSTPLSEPIQPLIDRINWQVAKTTASAAYFRDRYYLSVPIDGSSENNAVLVYDFLNRAWSGYDTGETIKIKYLQVGDFHGVQQLFAYSNTGDISVYEYAEEDHVRTVPAEFTAEIFIQSQPSDGETLQINSGDVIRATQTLLLKDGDGNTLTDESGNQLYTPLDYNLKDPAQAQENLWGVGDYGAAPCEEAAENLYQGLTTAPENDTDPWEDFTTTVERVGCGVKLTDSGPILVQTDSPGIKVISTPAITFAPTPIQTCFVTRGYGYEAGNRKRSTRVQLYLETWAAAYEVFSLADGVNEEVQLIEAADTSKSRVQYLTVDQDDWDTSNVNDDHGLPNREDYSVTLPTAGMELGGGVVLDKYQAYTHKLHINRQGAFFRVKFCLTSGRAKVYAVTSGNIRFERRFGEHG